ncbi:hypothetical protein A2U10_05460 [Fusobacterium necrophorum subsp. funduliforme]|nr:hypothetical protein HMPREF9466_00080 [Fusobacterium necrophorum subsp. funduliforme 1_1_36S]KYL00903.1 hypothetical protein A2J06_04720 [Fusobacterium necrophorum subsp. funduliforme]KYL01046.1 hypothetical protein A2J05_04605 [Fusobacterium necrophorum subsp. funduliforme]KYM39119.1 hypothetical protein A2U10_05460 [Fusobacterium necrophorum subsp. funduliforme]KYM40495.1 hypothetical protein A2U03_04410 [Fusobacterium necrophorum subsp. funduliforme]
MKLGSMDIYWIPLTVFIILKKNKGIVLFLKLYWIIGSLDIFGKNSGMKIMVLEDIFSPTPLFL